MGVAFGVLLQQTDVVQGLEDLFPAFILVLEKAEVVQPFGDYVVYGRPFVQGSHRVLENHLDIAYDVGIQLPVDNPGNLFPGEEYFSLGGGIDPDYRPAYGCFARTGFSHQGERLAFVDIEVHFAYRGKGFLAVLKGDFQVFYR